MSFGQTPSQTVGPYFAYGLAAPQYGYPFTGLASDQVADEFVPGERIRIAGRVFDGAGAPIPDAMIEIWQADSEGRYAHPNDARASNQRFRGFGRFGTGTERENRFIFSTVKPGSVDGVQAPHINVIVFMRGMLLHAYTRIYFADEVLNQNDPVLQTLAPEARATLMAQRVPSSTGLLYRWEICMQGDKETVFFDG